MQQGVRNFWSNDRVKILAGRARINGYGETAGSRVYRQKEQKLSATIGLALQYHFSGITIDSVLGFFTQQEVNLGLDFNSVAA